MNQWIRRTPILIAIMALAAVLAPQASAAYGPPTFSFAFGSEGTGAGQFETPEDGIAFDKEGNVWISDSNNNRVQKFNSKGEYLTQFGSFGSGNGQLHYPRDIAIDATGNLWVVDSYNDRVQKFNSKGEFLLKFGEAGKGNGQLEQPGGIALGAEGSIWVADSSNKRVQKFNSKGEYVSQFGSSGKGNGQFESLGDVDIDASGNLLVADTGNNRVQKFNSKGEYVSQFGTKGTGNGQFQGPRGLALDLQGRIWVADRLNRRVQAFSPTGEYLTQFGKEGTGNGQFKSSPTGLAFDRKGDLWVGDTGNDRIQVFTRLWRLNGKTLSELGVKEATLVSSGTFTIEIPSSSITVSCTESGSGKISGTNGLEREVTLNCKLLKFEAQCTYSPTFIFFTGTGTELHPTGKELILTTSGECPWGKMTVLGLPANFFNEVGTESKQVSTTINATGSYGAWAAYYTGSSTWELTGAQAGKTLGLW